MFKHTQSYVGVLILLAAQLSLANVPLKTCPVAGQKQTKKSMYKAMQQGMVWKYSSGPIIFVAEDGEINQSPVASTYNKDSRGTFKIGYNYTAKECRRQIILEEQISDGVYNGQMAVEVCRPDFMQSFANADAKDIEDVISVNPDVAVLRINDTQKDVVKYFYDEDGYILPRFKIKLDEIKFKELPNGDCELYTDINNDYQGYAGVGSFYNFTYSMQGLLAGQVWTFDASGESVPGGSYTGELVAPSPGIAIEENTDEPRIPDDRLLAEMVVHEVDTFTLERMFGTAKLFDTRAFRVEPNPDYVSAVSAQFDSQLPTPLLSQYFTRVEIPEEGEYLCKIFENEAPADSVNIYQFWGTPPTCTIKDGNLFYKNGTSAYQGHFFRSKDGFQTFIGTAQYGTAHESEMYSKFEHKLPTFGEELQDGSDAFGVLTEDHQRRNYYLHMHMGTDNHRVIHFWKKTEAE